MTLSLNSKACNGSMPVLETLEVHAAGISWQDNVYYFFFSGMLKVYCSLTLCLTKWQLQGLITLTYFTNCLSQLKRSAQDPGTLTFAWQYTCSLVTRWTSCFTWIWIWWNESFTVFSWLGTKWLLLVYKFEETPPRDFRVLMSFSTWPKTGWSNSHILQASKNCKNTLNCALTKVVIILNKLKTRFARFQLECPVLIAPRTPSREYISRCALHLGFVYV